MIGRNLCAAVAAWVLVVVGAPARASDGPEARAETASCLAVEFTGERPCVKAEKPEDWLVQSDEDGRFKEGVRPMKVGRLRQVDNPDGSLWWKECPRHTLFLLLPQPVRSGKRYRIVAAGAGIEREAFALMFDERSSLNRNIKVNQCGYVPDAPKYAYAGGWLGSAGALPLDEYMKEFHLADARTGKSVFAGVPRLRMRHDQKDALSTSTAGSLTGEDVYELDFSRFTTPGEYAVVVPGMGRSFPFRIAADVYAQPFFLCARGIFHQRCGIEFKEPYTTFARKPCHRGPAIEIKATIVEHGSEDQDELVKKDPTLKTGKILDIWGGYHDAADFDRLIGHVRVPAVLLTLYEMFPRAFHDAQLNIPESGNGIPDIVDEARWGVDFWMRMQDPEDGGVRGGAGPNAAVTAPAEKDTHPIYVYAKDPVSSLSFAASAAQLARVLVGLGRRPEAAPYLEHAEKAWAYGATRGEKFGVAHALAALELFKATGKPLYHGAFLKRREEIVKWDVTTQERHMGHFAWSVWMSCALGGREGMDETMRQACRERLVAAADRELQGLDSFAYRTPYTGVGGPPLRYGWGCGTNFFSGGEFCAMAWKLTGEKRYRDGALQAADFSLGCHPTGTVFITGVGQQPIKWAIHTFSSPLAIQIGAPVEKTLPGIPIFGVHAYPKTFDGWQKQLLYVYGDPAKGREYLYPPGRDWPDLRLFADVGWAPILSEFSVSSTMLHTVFLYGALLSAGD